MVAGRTRLDAFAPALAAIMHGDHSGQTVFEQLEIASTSRVLRPRFMPIRSAGQNAGLVIFLEDTERLRREAQQMKLAALGRLTASIAHEIRNPLGAISHAAQLLGEDASDPATQRLVRIIGDNSQRLDRLVRSILELNRRDRALPVDIRLYDWLGRFTAEFSEIEAGGQPLQLDCPQGAVVRFDEGQLHQVLWNLCRNGWRYSCQKPGSLRLVVASQADHWVLDVRDDGPGIDSKQLGQLFEPFYTTDSKGTGLGLYIAREICSANDSVLEYLPTALGACFRITFPARPA